MSPLARAHSRTRHASTSAAAARMWPRELGERQAFEGQAATRREDRLDRVQAGQQPRLHVGDPWPVGHASIDTERARGRGPRVEHRVHVADQQDPRTAGRSAERRDDRGAIAAVGIGSAVDLGAEPREERGGPATDLVDPVRGVRAAVDAHEVLEIGEVVGQVGRHGRLDGGELDVDRIVGRVGHPGAVYAAPRLLSCRDRATDRDPYARRAQRLSARTGGQAGARRRPAADVVRPARPGATRACTGRRTRGTGSSPTHGVARTAPEC